MRWRRRIGEEGCEWLLEHSIKAAQSSGMLKRQSLSTVIVDTTVQPEAIAHPTDSRLLNRAREQLVAAAQDAGIELLKRRQAIEPTIGHMKTDRLLARNWLKGVDGDAIHAVLCGAGHNIRLILRHLRVLFLAFIAMLLGRPAWRHRSEPRRLGACRRPEELFRAD